MDNSGLPEAKKPFSIDALASSLIGIESKKGFPPPSGDKLDQLVTQIKPGDFINWQGYADFELEFVYQEVLQKGVLFGMEIPSFDEFVKSYREHQAENPVYGVVIRVLDKRTRAWQEYSKKAFPHEKFVIPKKAPVIVNAINFELQGEDDSYSLMSLHFYDTLVERDPFPIQRVRKVTKEEALSYIVWKINKYQQTVDTAIRSDDPRERLYACVTARKQFRFAELGVALYHTDNPLATVQEHKEGSLVRPETGYFVLLPDHPVVFRETGPKLVFIKDENPFQLNEREVGKFIHLMVPNIFGETNNGREIGYRCFGVPHRNLALIEGIDAINIYRPATNLSRVTGTTTLSYGQKSIETFLLKDT